MAKVREIESATTLNEDTGTEMTTLIVMLVESREDEAESVAQDELAGDKSEGEGTAKDGTDVVAEVVEGGEDWPGMPADKVGVRNRM